MRLILLSVGVLVILGCAASPTEQDIARLEETEARIDSKLRRLENLGASPVEVSCSELAFTKVGIEGGAGHLVVACETSVRAEDAYDIVLLVGNPYEVEYKELLVDFSWQRRPASGILNLVAPEYSQEEQSAGPLSPGQWKRVRFELHSDVDNLEVIQLSIRVPSRRLAVPPS